MHIIAQDDLVNKHNNTYNSTIKIKPIARKSSAYTLVKKQTILNFLIRS